MKRTTLALATLLGFAAAPVLAQDMPEIADADGNGTWSLTELQVAYPTLNDEGFASIDANKDGAVDQAELAAAMADGLLPAAN